MCEAIFSANGHVRRKDHRTNAPKEKAPKRRDLMFGECDNSLIMLLSKRLLMPASPYEKGMRGLERSGEE
ncbi:MAG: hypothetical protein DWQ07_18550 [Chloroflexi bacterium]|nr:MAG: hypothetical protein DWQ07_18550 [Chloroflexota bacterium]MBL1194932.1 hypothetical protein [Chloroflexota bacterium]